MISPSYQNKDIKSSALEKDKTRKEEKLESESASMDGKVLEDITLFMPYSENTVKLSDSLEETKVSSIKNGSKSLGKTLIDTSINLDFTSLEEVAID